MDIIRVVSVGIVGVIVTLLLRANKPDIAILATMATSIVIIIIVLNSFNDVIETFSMIVQETGISEQLFTGVLKIIGIGYLTEYASDIALDAESKTISSKIQLAGKVTIFVLTMPIIKTFLSVIKEVIV